ncbi:MAG: SDR family oxidoreductase [Hyphomicrobiaceae bacterium]|nr:MAG: SDR family oxidoreductase [Hyphomicrobiaceae bacterium]
MSAQPKKKGLAAIVTGGASGIGLATVERLLTNGWKVAALDRDANALAAARERLAGSKGARFDTVDVTDEALVERRVAEAAEAFTGLSGVVNSAGIAADKHVFETSADLFRKILDVNVVGSFLVARAAARIMREKGGGSIVNIASISGLRGSKGRSAYGASKGAVITLTQVMATDLARFGIRVNAIAPGPIETPLVKSVHTPADRALYRRFVPMRRYGQPAEVASVAAFLLDPGLSSYVTGEIIAVDGGFRGAGIFGDD